MLYAPVSDESVSSSENEKDGAPTVGGGMSGTRIPICSRILQDTLEGSAKKQILNLWIPNVKFVYRNFVSASTET